MNRNGIMRTEIRKGVRKGMGQHDIQVLLGRTVKAFRDGISGFLVRDARTGGEKAYEIVLPCRSWRGSPLHLRLAVYTDGFVQMEADCPLPASVTEDFMREAAGYCRLSLVLPDGAGKGVVSRGGDAFGLPEAELLDFIQDVIRFDALLWFPDWRKEEDHEHSERPMDSRPDD